MLGTDMFRAPALEPMLRSNRKHEMKLCKTLGVLVTQMHFLLKCQANTQNIALYALATMCCPMLPRSNIKNGFKIYQQSVFIMLPADREGYGSNGEYYPLELMVTVMFLFQAFRVGRLVYRQVTSDVFLIDWEKVTWSASGLNVLLSMLRPGKYVCVLLL